MTFQDSDSSAPDNPVIEVTEIKGATVDAESDIHCKPWYEEIRQLKLSEKPSTSQRKAIVMAFWFPHMDTLPLAITNLNMDSYFSYYNSMTRRMDGIQPQVNTHAALADIAGELNNWGKIRIRGALPADGQDIPCGWLLLHLITTFTMTNTTLPDQPSPWIGLQTVSWGRDQLCWNISDKLGNEPKLRHYHLTLGKSFTARNIAQVAGLRIIWTDNVLDHLRLSDGDTMLHVSIMFSS
jgi:hypothetical protein